MPPVNKLAARPRARCDGRNEQWRPDQAKPGRIAGGMPQGVRVLHAKKLGSGSPANMPKRMRLLRKYPYLVLYHELDDEVEVVAVAHTSRRPRYWKDHMS